MTLLKRTDHTININPNFLKLLGTWRTKPCLSFNKTVRLHIQPYFFYWSPTSQYWLAFLVKDVRTSSPRRSLAKFEKWKTGCRLSTLIFLEKKKQNYKKHVLGLLALKSEPSCFCTLDGRGNLIFESCICFTAARRVSLAATGSTRMIWKTIIGL